MGEGGRDPGIGLNRSAQGGVFCRLLPSGGLHPLPGTQGSTSASSSPATSLPTSSCSAGARSPWESFGIGLPRTHHPNPEIEREGVFVCVGGSASTRAYG